MKTNWKHKSVKQFIKDHKTSECSDPIDLIKAVTKNLTLEAFTKGWSGPPFDVIDLAKSRGIEVSPNEIIPDARIIPKSKNTFKIEYNPFQRATRINFSIAHEIGHTLFSDCSDTIRYRSEKPKLEANAWELEFLCNLAAAEILLPYAAFYKDANDVELNLDSLKALANKYEASLESVFIRFCEVANDPCAIMLTRFNEENKLELDYFVKSESSNVNIPKPFTVPLKSNAYDCLKSGWTANSIEEWNVFGNTRYRVHSIGLPALRKHRSSRVGLLLVPELYDSSSSPRIYMVNGDATEPRGKGNKIIAQVVNTSAGTGFGFGKALAKKYPISKKALSEWKKNKDYFKLGETQLVHVEDEIYVEQMIAQKGLYEKNGEIPLKYNSLQKCLVRLREDANMRNASVHMPMIGAGQAKGDWGVIQGMIYQELVKKGIDVTVYILPGTSMKNEKSENLTLFDDLF